MPAGLRDSVSEVEEEALAALELLLSELEMLVARLEVHDGELQEVYVASYLSSLIGTGCGFLLLARSDSVRVAIGIPITLRSMLETLVSLLFVIKDKRAPYLLIAEDLEHKIRAANSGSKGNPFFNPEDIDPDQAEDRWERRMEELAGHLEEVRREGELGDGRRLGLSWSQKFDRVGKSNEYRALYWMLSAEAHGSVGVVESRHLVVREDGPRFDLLLYQERSDQWRLEKIDLGFTVLAEAGQATARFFESEFSPSVLEDFRRIRTRIAEHLDGGP